MFIEYSLANRIRNVGKLFVYVRFMTIEYFSALAIILCTE